MICHICKLPISDPYHIEIHASIVKDNSEFKGTISFLPEEKGKLSTNMSMHKNCWFNLIDVKQDIKELTITSKEKGKVVTGGLG